MERKILIENIYNTLDRINCALYVCHYDFDERNIIDMAYRCLIPQTIKTQNLVAREKKELNNLIGKLSSIIIILRYDPKPKYLNDFDNTIYKIFTYCKINNIEIIQDIEKFNEKEDE